MLKQIVTRVEENEVELLKKAASEDKRTVSSFMRKCALDRAKELIGEQ